MKTHITTLIITVLQTEKEKVETYVTLDNNKGSDATNAWADVFLRSISQAKRTVDKAIGDKGVMNEKRN